MAILRRPALAAPPMVVGQHRRKLLVATAAALVIIAAALQVRQFSRMTSAGYRIDELRQERAAQQAENSQLEAEVARLSALARVDWEARTRLGMQPAARTMYLTVNNPVPDRQLLPTRFASVPDSVAAPAEAPLWRRLIAALRLF